ncbi:hypothetical protein SH661x_000877 [Planctomicrobium sp. SH661]|uniref:hypothetical protein n=1 Tax=Planctomicrobium sp. SH661 TaxID=3448124 RepID=UPI003F5C89BF
MPEQVTPTLVISGVEPGQVRFRLDTVVEPPTIEYCNVFSFVPDGFDLQLSASGEELFETPSDVNAALSAALGTTFYNFFNQDGGFALCGNQCDGFAAGGSTEVVNDASATTELVWGQLGPGPDGSGMTTNADCVDVTGTPIEDFLASKTLSVSITAPRKPGVNLRQIVEAVKAAPFPAGLSPTGVSELTTLVDNLLAGSLVGSVSSVGTFRSVLIPAPFGFIQAYYTVGGTTFNVRMSRGDYSILAGYSFSGGWDSNGTLTTSGKLYEGISDELDDDSFASDMVPGSIALTHEDNSDRTITATLPLSNGNDPPDPYTWYIKTAGVDDRFQEIGSFTESVEHTETVIDPGRKPKCVLKVEYDNPHRWLGLGSNIMELMAGYVIPLHLLHKFPCVICKDAFN